MEEDERLKAIENERLEKEKNTSDVYNNQINNVQNFQNEQTKLLEEHQLAQENVLKEREALQEKEIKQQEEKVKKEGEEQKLGSYGEYKQTINDYGVQAEQLAEQGFSNAGVSETAKTAVYQAYLTRKAEINKTVSDAVLAYQNQLAEAKISNSEKLMQIASSTLEQKMVLALNAFNMNNQLVLEKQAQLQTINDNYYNRKQNTIAQIAAERAEQQRQLEWEKEYQQKQAQWEESRKQWEKEFALQEQQYATQNSLAERQLKTSIQAERNSQLYINQDNIDNDTTPKSKTDNDANTTPKSLTDKEITTLVKNLMQLRNPQLMKSVIITSYKRGETNDRDTEKLLNILGLQNTQTLKGW